MSGGVSKAWSGCWPSATAPLMLALISACVLKGGVKEGAEGASGYGVAPRPARSPSRTFTPRAILTPTSTLANPSPTSPLTLARSSHTPLCLIIPRMFLIRSPPPMPLMPLILTMPLLLPTPHPPFNLPGPIVPRNPPPPPAARPTSGARSRNWSCRRERSLQRWCRRSQRPSRSRKRGSC